MPFIAAFRRPTPRALFVWMVFTALVAGSVRLSAAATYGRFKLPGHVPAPSFVTGQTAPVDPNEQLDVALVLPLRNQSALQDFLRRVKDPQDPLYGHYLSPEEFKARFSPTEAQYAAAQRFARASGLSIRKTHAGRSLLDLQAPVARLEAAFATKLQRFQARLSGRIFRAPSVEPSIPSELAGTVVGVVGLDNLAVRRHHAVTASGGTGPNGGFSPSDIKAAYNLSGVSQTGAGQRVALFQLDGYTASDITAYAAQFGLQEAPRTNILIDGFNGAAGSGSDEVTLDIELVNALAPGLDGITVYEGPNTSVGALDTYQAIADDNTASAISSSWGIDEGSLSSSELTAENNTFQQYAAQGQSFFAAAGDNGAYDTGRTSDGVTVDDPAANPFCTGVGGTTLATVSAGGAYSGESVWNGGSVRNGAGGGGISTKWSIPSWQAGLSTAANKGSSTKRMVPDISLDADPNSGYAIFSGGQWVVFGGTSCGAPLWAAFASLVNERRHDQGQARAGNFNPLLYQIASTNRRSTDFHDVSDGTTNLFYPSTAGYDLATGWGSMNGANLMDDLAATGGSTFTISGTVTLNGAGLQGVTVTAGTKSATTAANGAYTITGLSAGTYTVTPSLSGYTFSPTSASVTITNANISGKDFTATAVADTYSISGTVTQNAVGLGGVTISVGSVSTTTLGNGTYTLSGLAPGNYTITPSLNGFTFSPTSRPVTIVNANLSGQNFTATSGGSTFSISGTVTANGGGLSGVTVSAGGHSSTTTGLGTYTISGLAAGTYTVTPTKTGYSFSPSSTSATISSANLSAVNFTATATTFNITGRITLNGGGLGGVLVSTSGATATTSGSGDYVLSGLLAGSYTVTPSLSGYTFSPTSRGVSVTSADAINVDFAATAPTFTVSGTVSNGKSGLAGVTVSAGGHSAVTGSTGAYTITGLTAGTYTVTPSLAGDSFSPSAHSTTITTTSVTGVNFTGTQLNTLVSFTLSKSSVAGGGSVTGHLKFLRNLTAAENVTITSSNNAVLAGPKSVHVGKGKKTASFTWKTKKVVSTTKVTLTADDGMVTRTASLTVR